VKGISHRALDGENPTKVDARQSASNIRSGAKPNRVEKEEHRGLKVGVIERRRIGQDYPNNLKRAELETNNTTGHPTRTVRRPAAPTPATPRPASIMGIFYETGMWT